MLCNDCRFFLTSSYVIFSFMSNVNWLVAVIVYNVVVFIWCMIHPIHDLIRYDSRYMIRFFYNIKHVMKIIAPFISVFYISLNIPKLSSKLISMLNLFFTNAGKDGMKSNGRVIWRLWFLMSYHTDCAKALSHFKCVFVSFDTFDLWYFCLRHVHVDARYCALYCLNSALCINTTLKKLPMYTTKHKGAFFWSDSTMLHLCLLHLTDTGDSFRIDRKAHALKCR